jgi:putative component of toxin-antitoxin plasmid stabilization module
MGIIVYTKNMKIRKTDMFNKWLDNLKDSLILV